MLRCPIYNVELFALHQAPIYNGGVRSECRVMFRRCLLLVVSLGLLSLPAQADDKTKTGGSGVYKSAVPSVVWIHSKRTNGLATGSGSLIDVERRLVLTNYHVVQEVPTAGIFFPQFRDNQPIAEKDYYKDRAKRLAIPGKVVALDKKADLAIIQLDRLPKDVAAIKLATSSPDPGDNVHSIGSAGKSDALFGYVKGSVRQVYRKDWKAELEPKKIISFSAKVVETDSPTNPGDSGGPLMNDVGELVGVTQGGAINAQLVSTFIDVSEVKSLMETKAIRDLKVEKPKEPKLRVPNTVKDGAKLFSEDAIKKANELLVTLHKAEVDVLVEALAKSDISDDKLKELRSAKQVDRSAFFRDFTRERMIKTGDAEIGFTICNDPKSLYVEMTGLMKKTYGDDFQKKIAGVLTDGLKAGKPDDALLDALKLIQEAKKK
jgi:S1-C subfamily serine protease